MNPSNTVIVVSTYIKPVPWVDKLKEKGFEVRLYTKENPESKYNVPVNRGNEASAYLKYFIDNYEDLPEYSILLHDHEYSYHQEGSIIDAISAKIGTSEKFWNFNIKSEAEFYGYEQDELINLYNIFLKEYCGDLYQYGEYIFGRKLFAQFLLHKSLILGRPKEMYEKIYEWLITKPVDRFVSGFFLEVFWDIIFQQVKPVDFFPKVIFLTDSAPPEKIPNIYYGASYIDFYYLAGNASTEWKKYDPSVLPNYNFVIYFNNSIKNINFIHVYSGLKFYNIDRANIFLTLDGDKQGKLFFIRSISNSTPQRLLLNDSDLNNSQFLGNNFSFHINRFKIHSVYEN